MPIRIALMRSVVINGRRVKGEEARGLAEAAGAADVRSVGATGNLLFRSRKSPATLTRDLEAACAALYGQPTEMIVKTADQWRVLMKANPFKKRSQTSPARVLVWAMRDPLPTAASISCAAAPPPTRRSSARKPATSICGSAAPTRIRRNCPPASA